MKVIVDTDWKELLDNKIITHYCGQTLDESIQPASLDLCVGDVAYHVKHRFLPFQKKVKHIVDHLQTQTLDLNKGAVLYKGQTYLIPCLNVLMPDHYFGKISPKSSLGRIDVLIRAVVDNTGVYDTILPGTTGTVRLEVTPQSFNIKLHAGIAVTQLMLFDMRHHVSMYDKTDDFLFEDGQKIQPQFYEDMMILRLGLESQYLVGYKARYTDEIIDLTKKYEYPPHRFFEPAHLHGGGDHKKLILEKGRFYILTTKEQVHVPPRYSIELVPSTHLMGELRVHYAGFFDPGFGGDTGATGVFEIRTHEDVIAYDGQPICLMQVYTNTTMPEKIYGQHGNHYQFQKGPRLAKYFKQ